VQGGKLLRQYMLAPMWGVHLNNPRVQIFGAYDAPHEGGHFILDRILFQRRLPVIFDLDETLIKARAQSQLLEALCQLEHRRSEFGQNGDLGEARAGHYEYQALLMQMEQEHINRDLKMLNNFAEFNAIQWELNGSYVEYQAEEQKAYKIDQKGETAIVKRPVISLKQGRGLEVAFTRIKADARTSMIFYVRPQWRSLWERLSGQVDENGAPNANPKPLTDSYVCTAGSQGYPHEAWRLLDSGGALIPYDRCK